MPSLIVSLLAKLPTDELEGMRDHAKSELERLTVELGQIEEALAKRQPRTPIRKGAGSTRSRIIALMKESPQPLSPAEIRETLVETGGSPKAGAIHNMIGRLVKQGVLAKVADGLYAIAPEDTTSNGELSFGAERNGDNEPLSRATYLQEGRS